MTEIDKLEGKELAEAVALKQGMTKVILSTSGRAWFDIKGNMWMIADKEPGLFGLYRPDINIAQAWELGADWHGWHSEEHYDYTRKTYFVFTFVCLPHHIDSIQARCDYKTTDEKSEAYATARCRAFLKAKEAPDD